MITCVTIAFVLISSNNSNVFWRENDRDASNVAYVFIKMHGENPKYHSIVTELKDPNLLRINNALCSRGINTQITRPQPHELFNNCPSIVAMNSFRYDGITFAILVAQLGDSVELWLGGKAVFRPLSKDEFLRAWTGIAILPARMHVRSYWLSVLKIIFLAMALALVIAYFKKNSTSDEGSI